MSLYLKIKKSYNLFCQNLYFEVQNYKIRRKTFGKQYYNALFCREFRGFLTSPQNQNQKTDPKQAVTMTGNKA